MSKTDRDLTVYEFERRVNVSKKYKQSLQNDGQELNRSQSQNNNDLIETKKNLLIQEKIYTQDQNLNKLVDYVKYDQIRFDDQEKRYQKYEKNYDQSDQQQQDNQHLQYQEKQKISSQKYYDQNDKQFYQDENLKKFTQQIQEKQIQSKENQLGVVKQKQNILNYDNNQHIIQIQNNQEKFDRFVKKNDHSQKQDLQSQIDKNNDLLFQNEKENYYNFKDRNQNSKYQSREKSNQQDLQILSSNLNSKNNYLNEQQYKKDIENQETQLQQSNKFLHSHEQKNQKLNVQNLSKNFAQIMSKQGLTEQIQQKSLDSSIMGSIIINDNDLKTGSKIESQQEFEKYFQIYIQSSIMDIDYIITKLSAFNQFQDMCKEIKLKRFSKIQFLEKFFLFMQKIIKSFKATCETSKTVNGQVSAQYLKVKGQDQSIMTQVLFIIYFEYFYTNFKFIKNYFK